MAAVLRKNRAWLIDVIKPHLAILVPKLCSQDEAADLPESLEASSRANKLLNIIEKKMRSRDSDPYVVGLDFIEVLKDAEIGHLDNLEETAKEFREEQERASRRSSTTSMSSATGSLDSSNASVQFSSSRKHRESTGSQGNTRRLRRSSETMGEALPSQQKHLSHSHSDSAIRKNLLLKDPIQFPSAATQDGRIEEEEVKEETEVPSESTFLSAPEYPPDSSGAVIPFTFPDPCNEQLDHKTEGVEECCASDNLLLIGQQFDIEEQEMMNDLISYALENDRIKALQQYERIQKFYQEQLEAVYADHEGMIRRLQSTVEYHKKHSEDQEKQVADKDGELEEVKRQLEERKLQLADKEKEVYKLREQVILLEQKQLEVELLKSKQSFQIKFTKMKNSGKAVVKEKMKEWEKLRQHVDQLFEGKDITQIKLALVKGVDRIKGINRPNTH